MTSQEIKQIAKEFYISPSLVKTVFEVEAAGAGFFTDWNGQPRIKIQFEPHEFVRQLKKQGINVTSQKAGNYHLIYVDRIFVLKNKVDTQKEEYDAFNKAFKINPIAALYSTSWGLGQIMGYNFAAAGYSSVGEMITEFRKSEVNQLRGMMNFIKNTFSKGQRLIEHLRQGNFEAFAYGYNGPAHKKYNYVPRLQAAFNKFC